MGTLVAVTTAQRRRLREQFDAFARAAAVPKFRTMREFAEAEIRLPPNGPVAGDMFKVKTQPWTGHWLDEVDSQQYVFHVLVALVQGGKTLLGWVIPAMYHLFERNESVTCAVPIMDMAYTKWDEDFLPILKASRYAHLIPTIGVGAKGGKKFESITFLNGVKLKFVGAAGSDTARSGFTTKVLVMTEVNKMRALSTSKEAGPIAQFFARLKAHEMQRMRIFMECTVDDAQGEIWTRYLAGTASRLMLPCPKCGHHVGLERTDFKGWQEAEDEIAAREKAHYACSACAAPWTNDERKEANRRSVLVSRGQEITPDGAVVGSRPRTLTFSMRVNIANSNLKGDADLGWEEWDAKHNPDDEGLKEKTLQQFSWVMPWGGEAAHQDISPEIVASRLTGLDKGECPEDIETLVLMVDVHQKSLYWALLATGANRTRSFIDYGIHLNPDPKLYGSEEAIAMGLTQLADEMESRRFVTEQGRIVRLDLGAVDGGNWQHLVVSFMSSRGGIWRTVKGQGRKDAGEKYQVAKEMTADVWPGDHWAFRRQPATVEAGNKPWWMILADTSYWMHQLHSGFMMPAWMDAPGSDESSESRVLVRRPGSCALYGRNEDEHLRNVDATVMRSSFAAQVCGWIWKSEKTKTKGEQIDWHRQWDQDHFGDVAYDCLALDSVVRKSREAEASRRKAAMGKSPQVEVSGMDGRAFVASQRQ